MARKECQEGEIKSEGKCVLPVVFRKWENKEDRREVIALFPTLPSDLHGHEITAYQHVGQHGGADYHHVVESTKPAKPSEYRPLMKELRSRDYKRLKVYKKSNIAMDKARKRAVERWERME